MNHNTVFPTWHVSNVLAPIHNVMAFAYNIRQASGTHMSICHGILLFISRSSLSYPYKEALSIISNEDVL